MKKEEYGEEYNEHLLKQYILYVEMADQISRRRAQSNHLYISLLSAFLAFISVVVAKDFFIILSDAIFLVLSLVGILLCLTWYANIHSYKQLNKLKFQVIHEIEKELPFAGYKREWEIDKNKKNKYIRLTRIENSLPIFMLIPYLILACYALFHLTQ